MGLLAKAKVGLFIPWILLQRIISLADELLPARHEIHKVDMGLTFSATD